MITICNKTKNQIKKQHIINLFARIISLLTFLW